jgi:hypothetical protein
MHAKLLVRLLALTALLSAPSLASAYYDPGVQRWINRDPLGDESRALAFLSQTRGVKSYANLIPIDVLEGPNLHVFVHNRPSTGHDAHGLIANSVSCWVARILSRRAGDALRRHPGSKILLEAYMAALAYEYAMCGGPPDPKPPSELWPVVCPYNWGRPPFRPPWPYNPWNRTPVLPYIPPPWWVPVPILVPL